MTIKTEISVTKRPVEAVVQKRPIVTNVQNKGIPGADGLQLVVADNIYEFPTIGSEETLYCSLAENAVYRWSAEVRHYICVGRDYSEIEIINGGILQ